MKSRDIAAYCVKPGDTLHTVIARIDRTKEGIVLVVDGDGRLIGTITDGDVRRFLLANHSVNEPCERAMCARPTLLPEETSAAEAHARMKSSRLRHLPVVNKAGEPVGLYTWEDLIQREATISPVAVIMAGGEGKRLRPITEKIPKPMVEVGGKPILEKIVAGLRDSEITDLVIALNYRGEMIEDHFGNGSEFGVRIRYLREKEKMGTAGALSLLTEVPSDPFLVLNGDVVTEIQYRRLLEFHRQHRSVFTVAASNYHFKIPYGVLQLAGHFVRGVEEKPTHHFLCNAGIYCLSPELLRLVPRDRASDMTHLMTDVIREGLPVAAFPMHEYWVDVGQKDDLQRANDELAKKSVGDSQV